MNNNGHALKGKNQQAMLKTAPCHGFSTWSLPEREWLFFCDKFMFASPTLSQNIPLKGSLRTQLQKLDHLVATSYR